MPHFFSGVCEVAKILKSNYPNTNLGNLQDPLEELVYIILSGQTSEEVFTSTYKNFKKDFPTWKMVINSSPLKIQKSIKSGGLAKQKAQYLFKIAMQLNLDFGKTTLEPLRTLKTTDAEDYLCSLPGVGIKTARCVQMYSLNRKVFPVDIHCLRIMERLGWIKWQGKRGEYLAEIAQNGIPSKLRHLLHIRFIQHGRIICKKIPICSKCVISHVCPTANRKKKWEGKRTV